MMCMYDAATIRYLTLLAKHFPTIAAAGTEIINLQAILNLPKGTEHFLSDLHGEHEPFLHVLKNASGVIKQKINLLYEKTMSESERKSLATLVYYPEEKLQIEQERNPDFAEWCETQLYHLIELSRLLSSKYTRSKVRKSLPKDFAYIIEELLHEDKNRHNKEAYYTEIVRTIIAIGRAPAFITALARLIQRLAVDRLHIIGDIFDRGPGADIIMDALVGYHSVDVQWGNHDILWMGAAAGAPACIANVVRVSLRYCNTDTLEEGYGINLLPLATFAMHTYAREDNIKFLPVIPTGKMFTEEDIELIRKMQKAITVIQFKLEGAIIKRRPNFNMDDRLLLDHMNLNNYTVRIGDVDYPLNDHYFPTIDPNDPYSLTPDEEKVVERLRASFAASEKLHTHVRFLYAKGSMYLAYNANLLFHGCIPMDETGEFTTITVGDEAFTGKRFIDRLERLSREAYFHKSKENREYGLDVLWYLWCGQNSPLFGKTKMATFESYFIDDKTTHKEAKNPYYKFRDDVKMCEKILTEFGLDPDRAHIINGHVPVQVKDGESPIKADGKLLVIDGGLSKAYQKKTGIAGYTLISNSWGTQLVAHQPFTTTQQAVEEETDILSAKTVLEQAGERLRIADTDTGKEIKQQIDDLMLLLQAYKKGYIKELN